MIWNIFYKKKNEIYRSFIAMLIYGVVICLGYSYFGIEKIEPLIVVVASFLYIYVVCLFELTFIGKAFLCSITVSACVVKFILLENEGLIETIRGFFVWIYNPMIETEHFHLYIGIVLFLVAVSCYIIGLLCQKNKFIKYIIFIIGIAVAIYLMVKQEEVPKLGIAFMFSFFMLIIVEWIEARWEKNSDSNERVLYVVCLWPVWIIFIIFMCFTPTSSKPYDWEFVKAINENIEDTADTLALYLGIGNRDDFSVLMSGFSENALVGGDIEDSNKVLLQIDSTSIMETNVYLTGSVLDTFDGREWHRKYEEDNRERRFDTLETLYAVSKYDDARKDSYIDRASLKIAYRNLDSYCYFTPNKCYSLVNNGMNISADTSDSNISWKKRKRAGDVYSTDYYQLNLDHDIFYEMIEASQYDDEECWNSVCMNNIYGKVDFSILKEYQKRQKEHYTEDIELSEEMIGWLDDVTCDCSSNLERLRAIEKALSCFTYTKHPGKIPSSIDTSSEFLDYFVFEKQEGYCTYFATAFTLLARAEGFPARYVQGFSVPIKELKSISVTGNMTHAWPEVYFEGVGWIPFEPTPGYSSIRYTPWKIEGEGGLGKASGASGNGAVSLPEPVQRKQYEEVEEKEERETYKIDTEAVIWGLFVGLVLLTIILSADIMICRLLYKNKELIECYKWEIERCISVLARFGIKKKDDETLSDLQRIMEEKYQSWNEAVPGFIGEYECVLYGTKQVTKEMIDNVIAERKSMKKRLGIHSRLIEEFKDYRKK